MKLLSTAGFDRARGYLASEARPLDLALYRYHFEGAPAGQVIEVLASFQNADGGFWGLEPDVRTPLSSALASGIGLRLLKELGCRADHPVVRAVIGYLVATLDRTCWCWRALPAGSNDHPHAPWWHDEQGSLARTFDDFVIIPRAELVGLFFHYAAQDQTLVPSAWLRELGEQSVRAVESQENLGSGGGDDLVYALCLAGTAALPQRWRVRLLTRLGQLLPVVVTRNPADWASYSIPPLKLAPVPESSGAALLADILPLHLDYLVDSQSPAGCWEPTWTWGDLYPEAWRVARREWRGELTLAALLSLRAYGRIARE